MLEGAATLATIVNLLISIDTGAGALRREVGMNATQRVRSVLCSALLALCLSVSPHQAWAQSTSTGTVSGQVVDAQGAMIAGAAVDLTDASTDSRQSTLTNEVGRYLFLNVHPGTYDLAVSKAGFKQSKLVGQKVAVGLELTLNVTLQVGATTSSIEVAASAGAELQTSNA